MTETELLLQIEEPMLNLRTQLNHARVIMGDLMQRYFHDLSNDPDTDEGRRWIAHDFKTSAIRAEIVEDAICTMDAELRAIELLRDQIDEQQA